MPRAAHRAGSVLSALILAACSAQSTDTGAAAAAGAGGTAVPDFAGSANPPPAGAAGNAVAGAGMDAPAAAGEGGVSGKAGTGAAAGSGGAAGAATGGMRAIEPARPPVVSILATTQLAQPTDLEFNPYVPDELWVMNAGDSSATIVHAASSEARSVERRLDVEGARHFMPKPNAFAFGARETTIVDAQGKRVEGTFATCPGMEMDFMGPTLWTSDLRIFAISKPDREPPFNGPDTGKEGPGSHIDMLHRTPTCTGIAWEGAGNVYWTYTGTRSMLVKYDFAKDHGIGNSDHSDGSIWRYPLTGIQYVPGVPSHLLFANGLVYMADTGHGRIVTFDPKSATESSAMTAAENVDGLREANDLRGGVLSELIASTYGLKKPSGLALRDQTLFVTDNETSTIHRFALDGTPQAQHQVTEVNRGGLAGITVGPDHKLYFVDMQDNRVLRLDGDF